MPKDKAEVIFDNALIFDHMLQELKRRCNESLLLQLTAISINSWLQI